MKYRALGASGIKASVVALGTWAIGGWMWGGTDEGDAIRAVHAAIDAGITMVDTAPAYGFGLSEEIVGKAIADRRDKVILATKCGLVWNCTKGDCFFHSDDKHPTDGPSKYAVHRYLGAESVRDEIEGSLRRLQTDYLDLYLTHWQDPTTPVEDTMGCLMDLKREGKIRAIGACNASLDDLKAYTLAGALDADQEPFNMLDRQIEGTNLAFCREREIAGLSYSSLAQGLLTGKIGPERRFAEGDQRNKSPRFSADGLGKVAAMLADFQPVADRHGISLAQLAIAWTVAQPGLTHALCGARNPQQAIENAAAGDVTLSDGDLRAIDQAIEAHAADIP